MVSRSLVTGAVTSVIIILLFIVVYLVTNTPPFPSISSSSSRPNYIEWDGFGPFLRLLRQSSIVNATPNNPDSLSHHSLFSWFNSIFSSKSPLSTPFPSLPHVFKTSNFAGISVAYHVPFPSNQLAGVVLLFHACRQSASDWFTLPEHRRLASQLLRHRLAILAITSSNRITKCWSTRHPASKNYDIARVRLALRQWSISQGIAHGAPFYAVAVSSGASFLSVLSAAQPPIIPSLASQALYLSSGNLRAIRNASASSFPNTIFVHLHADLYYAPPDTVAAARIALLDKRVPLVADLPLNVEPWTATSIHEHEPLISEEESAAIFHHLRRCNENIECAVRAATAMNSSMAQLWDQHHLRRSLVQIDRVFKGKHEMTASHAAHVVDWLLQNGRLFIQSDQKEST